MSNKQNPSNPAQSDSFPFNDIDRVIDEERALPDIPDFPSLWKIKKTSDKK